MDNLYSSFYLYRKYEVIGDELIDLGITSIDADGTQEAVVKEECDPACGCVIYRWVQTEDTVCIEVQHRWTESGTTCIGYDKYQNNIKEESIDGVNWSVVIPEEYSASTLIQRNSEDCGYIPPFEGKYRLVLNDSTVVTAACDSSSAVTSGISHQYSTTVVNTEIGNCVSSIDQDTFYLCYSLTSVTIPESVTTIGNRAFGECTGLTSVNLPTGLTSIGDTAFNLCSGLTSCTIPTGVTNIGDWAFYLCTHITDINIPSGITRINEGVFSACFSLTSITIPNSVTSIGNDAFSSCGSLTSITIPNSVTSIGRLAFYNCSGLTSCTINRGTPPTLGDNAFYDTNNCPIYVPCESVEAYKAATGWSTYASRIEGIPPCGQPTPASPKFTLTLSDSSVVSAECDSTSAITSAETSDYQLDIISATIGDCVTTIGNEAFRGCMTITSVTIPNSVTTIGYNAFNGCDLHEINLPNTLRNLGDGAFKYCQYLQYVHIPVGYVPNECFSHCPNLKDVYFSLNTTTIEFGAFSSCYSLESIEIPSAIESIYYEAFKNCENLASVYVQATTPPTLRNDSFDGTPIADGTGTIYVPCESVDAYKAATGWSVYASRIQGIPPCGQPTPTGAKFTLTLNDSSTVTAECDSTSSVTSGEVATQYSGSVTPALVEAEIGDCVKTIGGGAFYKCSGLTSVTISDNVKSISGFAFGSCTSLVTCNMGTGVTKMGSSVFQLCRSLTGITIPNGVTSIGMWTFYQCYSLTSITIPNSVTTIAKAAFNNCTGLTGSLLIPDSVTSIGEGAFSWCKGLSAATIGSGITTIGRNAFYNCNSLTSITVNATTPPALGEDPFSSTNKCPIYVPCESVEAYKAASGWSDLASRIEGIPPCGQPKVRHIIYDAETATKGYPAVINKNSSNNGRFSDSEGTYFYTIPSEVYELLCTNNIPLMVEFSQVNDEETIRVADSWWNTFYNSLPISTEEPLAIVLTTDMLERLVGRGLLLLNEYSKQIIVTKVYYEV